LFSLWLPPKGTVFPWVPHLVTHFSVNHSRNSTFI
jgi:hypothetical protein